MAPGTELVTETEFEAALWRLLAESDREDTAVFAAELEDAQAFFGGSTAPRWMAWGHAFAARRRVLEHHPDGAAEQVGAARELLEKCPPSAHVALLLAYLAHVEVAADRFDAAMHLAIDASVLTEGPAIQGPSRPLHQAHRWLSLALTRLDLEELAAAQALRGYRVADALPDLADRWRLLRLCAQQHAELAQTVRRRGDSPRSHELAGVALRCAGAARELPFEPGDDDLHLLDIVQAWALSCRDELDEAIGPMRRVCGRVEAEGGVWLRGYADLALSRLLARCFEQSGDRAHGEEAITLLVDAAGAFAAVNDRRRHRQCLLELGQATAAVGDPAEALHWLEAYRADTGRSHARTRELWADMFIRRSRLREAERQATLLRRHALEDPLTGLGNRRSAERRLGALRLGVESVSLAVIDIDRFKAVNDSQSHLHGDAALRGVADLLRQYSRAGDEVYRWAGDEFLVLLPAATEAEAVVVMDRLRAAVEAADWAALDLTSSLTVSIGVAAIEAGEEGVHNWRTLFDAADLHLFSAKRAGRNRVRATGPGKPAARPAERAATAAASVDDLVAEVLATGGHRVPGWAFAEEPAGAADAGRTGSPDDDTEDDTPQDDEATG